MVGGPELLSGVIQWLLTIEPHAVLEILELWLSKTSSNIHVALARAFLLMTLDLLMVREIIPAGFLGKLLELEHSLPVVDIVMK